MKSQGQLDLEYGTKLFGPRPADEMDDKTYGTKLFGPRPVDATFSGEYWDSAFGGGGYVDPNVAKQVLDTFDMGFGNAWGDKQYGLDKPFTKMVNGKEVETTMRKEWTGSLLPDHDKNEFNIVKEFNEALLRPLAAGIDIAMRTPYALARGLAEVEDQYLPRGAPRIGGTAAALMEAFPEGARTAIEHGIPRTLSKGRELGITNEQPASVQANEAAVNALRPSAEPSPTNRVISPAMEPIPFNFAAPPEPRDIHELVRRDNPELFDQYDEAIRARDLMRQHIDDLKSRAAAPFQEIIDTLTRRVGGRENELTKNQQTRLEAARHNLDYVMTHDDEEMTGARLSLNKFDREAGDLGPQVTAAYREARDRYPESKPADLPPEVIETANPDAAPTPPVREAPPPEPPVEKTPEEERAERALNALGLGPSPVRAVSQLGEPLNVTIQRDLEAAGRPKDEAKAGAQLLVSHYAAISRWFEGALGSAREVYNRFGTFPEPATAAEEAAVAGRARPPLGMYDFSTRVLKLFKDANASTFIHEMHHHFLETILNLEQHPAAPQDFTDTVAAVRDWLGMSPGQEAPTRAQHEQFARGGERYFLQGTAPSARLADAFEKFRDWLTQIYQTVVRMKEPLSADIQELYGRLLTGPNKDAVIVPDRAVGMNFADKHVEDLEKATPETALADADRMRAERDLIAQVLPTEINNARRRARIAKETGSLVGGAAERPAEAGGAERGVGVPTGGREGAGAESVGAGNVQTPVKVSKRGAGAAAESTPPSGPNEPFKPVGDHVTEADGTVRLDNIDSPTDVDDAIRNGAVASGEPAGPRGVLTDAETFALADAIGIEPSEVPRVRVATAFNSAEINQLTRMLVAAETKIRDMMKAVANGTGDMLEFAQSIMRLEMLQGKAVQAGSEWGRAGRALNELKMTTGARSVEQLNSLLKSTTGRDYDTLMQLAMQGNALPTPRQVGQAVRRSRPQMSPMGRAITYVVTNSYLSGPITHAIYFAGNNLRSLLTPITETAAAGMVGAIRTGLGLGPQDRAYMREVGAGLHGVMQGSMDGWVPALQSYQAGYQTPLPGSTTASNPFNHASPFGTVATNILGQPTKIVAGIHQFSRVQFYTQFLYQYALRQAISEGLTGNALDTRAVQLRNDTSIMARARNAADTAMFQRQTPWYSLQHRLTDWTDQYAAAKILFPFMKIGFEMTREGIIKRSPLAFADTETRNALLMREGGAAFDEAAGKVIVGTAALGTGLYLASQGMITGNGPTNPQERYAWLLKHQPYSLEIGSLRIPLKGLGPQMNMLMFGADLWSTAAHAKDSELGTLATEYFHAVVRGTLDEGFFKDLANLAEAYNDPGRFGVNYVTSVLSGFIPYSTLLSQVNRGVGGYGIDPYSKETTNIIDSMLARIPGASWMVDARIDRFGNPIRTRGISPDPYANDPTANWLDRLGIGPSKIDRSVNGVRLTEDQYNSLEIMAGRLTKQFLDNAVAAGIENQPKGVQIRELERLTSKARHLARTELKMNSLGTQNDIVEQAIQHKLQQLQ